MSFGLTLFNARNFIVATCNNENYECSKNKGLPRAF